MICKETGLKVWLYTEGYYCDQCNGDKPCEVENETRRNN